MPFGREVSLGPGHIVLDGKRDPLKRDIAPIFGACLLWPLAKRLNGWIKMPLLGTALGLGPGHIDC